MSIQKEIARRQAEIAAHHSQTWAFQRAAEAIAKKDLLEANAAKLRPKADISLIPRAGDLKVTELFDEFANITPDFEWSLGIVLSWTEKGQTSAEHVFSWDGRDLGPRPEPNYDGYQPGPPFLGKIKVVTTTFDVPKTEKVETGPVDLQNWLTGKETGFVGGKISRYGELNNVVPLGEIPGTFVSYEWAGTWNHKEKQVSPYDMDFSWNQVIVNLSSGELSISGTSQPLNISPAAFRLAMVNAFAKPQLNGYSQRPRIPNSFFR